MDSWSTLTIARVLVKLKNHPAPDGNYFYAVYLKPDPDDGIETETYYPASVLREMAEEIERRADQGDGVNSIGYQEAVDLLRPLLDPPPTKGANHGD